MSSPRHLAISQQLHQQILQGDYPAGSKLPSEHQLMASFSVSRITVRQAIANLVNQGLVTTQRGKGVFVNQRHKIAHSLSSPLLFVGDDMARQGIDFSMQNLLFEAIAAPASVRSVLQLADQQAQVYWQKKLFLMSGVVSAIDISYVPYVIGHTYGNALQCDMTFPTLEANGIPIERIEALLECTHADLEISQFLQVPLGHPLILYQYTAYSSHGRVVVYGQSLSPADRFCYTVSLERSGFSTGTHPLEARHQTRVNHG